MRKGGRRGGRDKCASVGVVVVSCRAYHQTKPSVRSRRTDAKKKWRRIKDHQNGRLTCIYILIKACTYTNTQLHDKRWREAGGERGREGWRSSATYLPLVVVGELRNGCCLPRPLQAHKHDHVRLPLLHLVGLGARVHQTDELLHYCALYHLTTIQPGRHLGQIDLFFDGIPQDLDHFNVDIRL